jgi:hypothetical protein
MQDASVDFASRASKVTTNTSPAPFRLLLGAIQHWTVSEEQSFHIVTASRTGQEEQEEERSTKYNSKLRSLE